MRENKQWKDNPKITIKSKTSGVNSVFLKRAKKVCFFCLWSTYKKKIEGIPDTDTLINMIRRLFQAWI